MFAQETFDSTDYEVFGNIKYIFHTAVKGKNLWYNHNGNNSLLVKMFKNPQGNMNFYFVLNFFVTVTRKIDIHLGNK